MNEPTDRPAPPAIESRSGFTAALHWGFGEAMARSARRIVCVDRDFTNWPLGDAALLEALTGWIRRPQRQLVLLGGRFDEVPRRHPRFVAWRRAWGHAVPAWTPPEDLAAELPTLLFDDGPVLVRLFDAVHWRGRAEFDDGAARLYRDEVDAVLQRSEPAFPVTDLGL
jgi:hypothetical protein